MKLWQKIILSVVGIGVAVAAGISVPVTGNAANATSTWVRTVGIPVYDTSSGNLDVGYYEILNGGVLFGHLATSTTATTTRPTGFYVPPNALGLTLAHVVGTRYIDTFADGKSYIGSSTIDANMSLIPNAPIPDEATDQAAGSAL